MNIFIDFPLSIHCGFEAFYAPEIEDWGAYCFCPVCHSVTVIPSKTLTLAITFES